MSDERKTHFADVGGRGGLRAREAGAIYIECGRDTLLDLSSTFEVDPAQVWSGEAVSSRGMMFTESNDGVAHLVDVVGSEYYPSPADFIEEARARGISRRISPKLNVGRLTPGKSRLIFIHPKAIITNLDELYEGGLRSIIIERDRFEIDGAGATMRDVCPRYMWRKDEGHVHDRSAQCLGLHWIIHTPTDHRLNRREISGVSYPVKYLPLKLTAAPVYQAGVIAIAPITGFSVVSRDKSLADVTIAEAVSKKLGEIGYRCQFTSE